MKDPKIRAPEMLSKTLIMIDFGRLDFQVLQFKQTTLESLQGLPSDSAAYGIGSRLVIGKPGTVVDPLLSKIWASLCNFGQVQYTCSLVKLNTSWGKIEKPCLFMFHGFV